MLVDDVEVGDCDLGVLAEVFVDCVDLLVGSEQKNDRALDLNSAVKGLV